MEKTQRRVSKELIADYAGRLGQIATDICKQLHKSKVTLKERFFLGLLERQSTILNDIRDILITRNALGQTSTFILFRCLLDDFILLLYLQSRNFQENDIINHTANAFKNKFKMLKESATINEKYFANKLDDLATAELYQNELKEFCEDPENRMFFRDVSKRLWKTFMPTSELIRKLPKTGINAANAHVLVLWQLYSYYVHYSAFSEIIQRSPESRQVEIFQLKEALSYVYKSVLIASHVLNLYGLTHEFKDPSFLQEELMGDFRQAEDDVV